MKNKNSRDVTEYLNNVIKRLENLGEIYDYTLHCDEETKETLKNIINNLF